MRYNSIPNELCELLSRKYTSLNFEIYSYYNYSNYTYDMTHTKDDQGVHNWEKNQWEVMGIDISKYPEEYNRYDRELLKDIDINSFDSRIKLTLI